MAIAVLGVLALLTAMSRKVIVVEAAIGVVVVVLVVSILFMTRRRKKSALADRASDTDFYADLRQQPGGASDVFPAVAATSASLAATATSVAASTEGGVDRTTSQGGNGTASPPLVDSTLRAPEPVGVATVGVADIAWAGAPAQMLRAAPPPLAVVPGDPPPGTPAAWLPDPGGAPDTLRYWDGNAWTQHFAQRS